MSDMDHYRDTLRHLVRPDDGSERQDADRIRLEDYEALYLRQELPTFAAYEAATETEEQIALAYAEYIDLVVRDEGQNFLYLYAHTEQAKDVLTETVQSLPETDLAGSILLELASEFGER